MFQTRLHTINIANRLFTALFMVLAVMMLVVSCPVKKLFQSNVSFANTFPSKTNNNPGFQQKAINNVAAVNGCSIKQVNKVYTFNATKKFQQPFLSFKAFTNQSGSTLYAYLSLLYNSNISNHPYYSNPLFLQHRRLLI